MVIGNEPPIVGELVEVPESTGRALGLVAAAVVLVLAGAAGVRLVTRPAGSSPRPRRSRPTTP